MRHLGRRGFVRRLAHGDVRPSMCRPLRRCGRRCAATTGSGRGRFGDRARIAARDVAAASGMARRIWFDQLPYGPERRRNLALALMMAWLIAPATKLAAARALDETMATHSLGVTLGWARSTPRKSARHRLAGNGAAFDRGGINALATGRWDPGALRREFMRGVGAAFDNRNAGSYFAPPLVSFV